MATKKILTVGLSLAAEDIEYCPFNSDISLLDWDIIIFNPDIDVFLSHAELFQGKPCLTDDKSFKLKATCEHWRREIKEAVNNGKNVFVYLSELVEVSVATGEKRTSGTGRNQKVTRIVTEYHNYNCLPIEIHPIKSKGQEIKINAKNSDFLSSYWHEFSSSSKYNVLIAGELSPCLLTKYGDKTVGAVHHSKNSNGSIVFLPDMDFYPANFISEDGEWTEDADQFSGRFIKAIISMDRVLKSADELTAEPDWAKSEQYKLAQEEKLASELLIIESKLEEVQRKKEFIIDKIRESGRLRDLLFEKGKPLERAILEALELIGFSAENYSDEKSEFDVVFESREGRLIGEAEGKDNKAINIEKLRQLTMNIHEDLEREEISIPAKSVLFGNAYRLSPINERPDPFTDKCKSSAATTSTALVFTPDLFQAALYLSNKKDAKFATKCRLAIFRTVGRVVFPVAGA